MFTKHKTGKVLAVCLVTNTKDSLYCTVESNFTALFEYYQVI